MSPLRDRRFVGLLAGQALNGIGSWCALIALWGYATYRFHAGPGQIALLSLSWSLPAALIGPLGGVPIDRLGPRRALMLADGCSAVVALALAFAGSYTELVVLGGVIGVLHSCSDPALSALAPRLVDDDTLLRANALIGAASMSAIAFGPLLAAGAIAAWGPRAAFLLDALTYLVGVAVVLPLRLRPVHGAVVARGRSAWADLVAGFEVVRSGAGVRRILTLASSVYLVWGAYAVVEPLYVRDTLHRPASTFALLQTVFGIALLANALLLTKVGERVARFRTLRAAAIAAACAAPVYVGTSSLTAAFVGIAVWGAATAWLVAPRDTLLQRATPVATHGRVLAVDNTLRSAAHAIALPLAALLVGGFGVRTAAFTFAVMPIVGVALTWRPRAAADAPVGGAVEVVPA